MGMQLYDVVSACFHDHPCQVAEVRGLIGHRYDMDVVFFRGFEDLPDIGGSGGNITQDFLVSPGNGHNVNQHRDILVPVDAGVISAYDPFPLQLLHTLLRSNAGHPDGVAKFLIAHPGIAFKQIQYLLICPVHSFSLISVSTLMILIIRKPGVLLQ